MDEVTDSGTEIVITKNGRPVSRLVPYRERNFGKDRDKIRILGDIIEPTGGNTLHLVYIRYARRRVYLLAPVWQRTGAFIFFIKVRVCRK